MFAQRGRGEVGGRLGANWYKLRTYKLQESLQLVGEKLKYLENIQTQFMKVLIAW